MSVKNDVSYLLENESSGKSDIYKCHISHHITTLINVNIINNYLINYFIIYYYLPIFIIS